MFHSTFADKAGFLKLKALLPLFIFLLLAAMPLLLTHFMGEAVRAGIAPDIKGIHEWFNSDPLTISGLRGKVVLVDFWTYSCINCIRTFPYLKAWDEKYRNKGLVIIGVHSPEFGFEKDSENVRRAIQQYEIKYPVAMDNDQKTWKAYANHYWPHKYLIDSQGNIRYEQPGEGGYVEMEEMIRKLLVEAGQTLDEEPTRVVAEEVQFREIKTPEIFFGHGRGGFLGNPKGLLKVNDLDYQEPSKIEENLFYLVGRWLVGEDNAQYVGGGEGKILIRYTAKSVNIVAGAPGRSVQVEVLLDGEPLSSTNAGQDIQFDGSGRSLVMIGEERLYSLVHDQTGYAPHTLTLVVGNRGLEAYTFTFG
ncbi:MAG: thioredoxin family protein [Nitrospira sp.]|nr:thioredoxin family protein [Nitrospira sp.]